MTQACFNEGVCECIPGLKHECPHWRDAKPATCVGSPAGISHEEQANRYIEDLAGAYETGNDAGGKAAAIGLAKLALGALLSIALSLEKLAEDGVTVSGRVTQDF